MSKFTDITVEKFDALITKKIELRNCPSCGAYGGSIIVDMPMYGKDGAYCKCNKCGFETKRKPTHIFMRDKEGRVGTPTIEKSLMGAIKQAVNDWNKG